MKLRHYYYRTDITISLIVCIGFIFNAHLASSQSCAPLIDRTCSSVIPVGTPIYVPPGMTLDILQTYSNRITTSVNFVAFVPEPCRSYQLQVLCATWLRPCHFDPATNATIPIPEQPCDDVCWRYYGACGPGLIALGIPVGTSQYFPPGYGPPLNCSNPPIDITAGNSTFYQSKAVNQTIPYNGVNYTVPCSQRTVIPVPAPSSCSDPLVVIDTDKAKNVCAFTCPLPSLTDDQYRSAKVMQGILGWTSWVASALLMIALVVNPRTRDFPRNLVIMTAAAANVAAGAIILPTYAGYDNTWCGGAETYLTPSVKIVSFDAFGLADIEFSVDETSLSFESSLCTFQGAMLQFGFLAAVFWWTIIAFNMCLELFLGRKLPLDKTVWKWGRFAFYNVVGWGVPFVLMVIPAAAGAIKFSPAGTYCFITGEDNNAWSLTFWFLPVGICILVGVILFIAALIRITILLVTIKKVKKLMFLYFRLSIFIFLYLALFIFIFAYFIQYANDKSDIEEGYEKYYKCLVGAYNIVAEECTLPDSVTNYGLVMLKAWAISSLGVLLFLIFVSWDVLVYWYQLFLAIGIFIVKRRRSDAMAILNRLVYQSTHTSLTGAGSDSLTITHASAGIEDEELEEEDEEMEERTEEASRRSSASSSSGSDEEK